MLEHHLHSPRGHGRLPDSPHSGAAGGAACGDLIRIAVRVEDGAVAEAGFDARGCGAARAAGSAVVELVEGRSFLDAARLGAADVDRELGGLLPGKLHAASLAAEALHRALGAAARDGAARLEPSANRTLVAMSGGVDSAVAAHQALDAGHEVVGVTLELWSDPATDGDRSCCSPQAVTGARALAHGMGIPHVTLDLRDRFRTHVVDDWAAEHAAGRTPNPCVRCNGLVRFGDMLTLAGRLGAARLATGHYARIGRDDAGPLLRAAVDGDKDQSYMLARLGPAALERLWFPLGGLTKPQVRELARAAGLSVAEKPESQDLCFLAGGDREALLGRLGVSSTRGELVALDGRVLGEHAGQETLTVGQRRGLGLTGPEPLYVVGKDPATARVTVGPRSALATTTVGVTGAWLHRDSEHVDHVKLRYRSEPVACRVAGRHEAGAHPRLLIELAEPVYGVAPGQVACMFAGDMVAGWAMIDKKETLADVA